ncbi:MAG: methionyl-tRNA formyltransferase [Patescibacteria group bacterium]|jgi:methionyl-tRNA formyltransferase
MKPLKIIFAGTPEFAVPYLRGLLADADFEVIGVITQPDRPSGRKQELTPPPVKVLATENNLKIWQPEKLKGNEELLQELKALEFDYLVVTAYGLIIPAEFLALAKNGNINVHPSLLPKYRGASPIQSAILSGEQETGISIMLMDEKMDHGPILAQKKVALTGEETNESLHFQLAEFGVPLLVKTIKGFFAGEIKPQEQDHGSATFCTTIDKEQARIDWIRPAEEIKRKIHAFYSWPIAWTTLDGLRLKILPPAEAVDSDDASEPGKIIITPDAVTVKCGEGGIKLNQLQLEGKKTISASDFVRGYKDLAGRVLK